MSDQEIQEEYKKLMNVLAGALDEAFNFAISGIYTGCMCDACRPKCHQSSCAVHNEPAMPNGDCDCDIALENHSNKQTYKLSKMWKGWFRAEGGFCITPAYETLEILQNEYPNYEGLFAITRADVNEFYEGEGL